MAVPNNLYSMLKVCLIFILVNFSVVYSDNQPLIAFEADMNKSINYATQMVVNYTDAFVAKINECLENENDLSLNSDDVVGLTSKELGIGIMYLNYKNRFACEKKERLELAYAVGYLQSLYHDYGIVPPVPYNEINQAFIYPSFGDIIAESNFYSFTRETQDKLIAIIGDSPFNLISAMDLFLKIKN